MSIFDIFKKKQKEYPLGSQSHDMTPETVAEGWEKERKKELRMEDNPYLPPHQRMVFRKLRELGNPPKPVPKKGEYACIECHGHGILRETSRRPTFGGGFDIEQHCDFCGWSEPIHQMAPWEKELMDQSMPRIMAEIRLSERPSGYAQTLDGQRDIALLRLLRHGYGASRPLFASGDWKPRKTKYPELEADMALIEDWKSELDKEK